MDTMGEERIKTPGVQLFGGSEGPQALPFSPEQQQGNRPALSRMLKTVQHALHFTHQHRQGSASRRTVQRTGNPSHKP